MTTVTTHTVPVDVGLEGALALSADADDVATEVGRQIGDLMQTLGLPTSPEVTIGAGDRGDGRPAVRLRIEGRPCRYSAALFARVLGSVRAELPSTSEVGERDVDGLGRAELTTLVGALCAEAIKRTPAVLAGPAALSAYAGRLAADHGALGSWERHVGDVVAAAVTLGISVADTARVAEVLATTRDDDVVAAQENLIAALAADTMELYVPPDVAAALGSGDPADPDDLLGFVAEGMFGELGIVFPRVVVSSPPWLRSGTFAVRLNDITGMAHALPGAGELVVNQPAETVGPVGGRLRPVLLPATDQLGSLAAAPDKERLEAMGATTWAGPGYVLLQLAAAMRTHGAAVVSQDRLLAQLDALEVGWPSVVRAARDQLPPAPMTSLVRRLVFGGVPLRHLPAVLDRIVDLPAAALGPERHLLLEDQVRFDGAGPARPDEPEEAEAFVRQGVRDQIAQRVSTSPGVVVAYLLDDGMEHALARETDEATEERILTAIRAELALLPPTARAPVLVTRPSTRAALHRLVNPVLPMLTVLALEDLPPDVLVQPVARIALSDGTV